MSFTQPTPAPARVNRSEFAVPGSNPRFLEKAATSGADVIFLDLEDSVAPDDKVAARKNVIAALNDLDFGRSTVSVRINGLDTHYMYRDVVDVLERGGERLDLIMIPKVGAAADVYALDMLVTQIETAMGRKKKIGFELIIETALGMANVESIAATSPRLESLHFGVADYAASTGARTTVIGGPNRDYAVLTDPDDHGRRDTHWGDMWHFAVARMVVAARANGLRPVDGPFGDIADADGYRAQAHRSAALGCEGKWAIHPSQIALAHECFNPPANEVDRARRILKAMREAAAAGKGAVSLDGRMIDAASVRQAEVMVAKARAIYATERSATSSPKPKTPKTSKSGAGKRRKSNRK
ncbi:MAG: CoA ester lyase [Proteobacteria bacterium]|nr:CoA ester lyase [Pseudomonadota bacterium]